MSTIQIICDRFSSFMHCMLYVMKAKYNFELTGNEIKYAVSDRHEESGLGTRTFIIIADSKYNRNCS